jgi:hypothetical protein
MVLKEASPSSRLMPRWHPSGDLPRTDLQNWTGRTLARCALRSRPTTNCSGHP